MLFILLCSITAMPWPSDGVLVNFVSDWKQVLNWGAFVSHWCLLIIINYTTWTSDVVHIGYRALDTLWGEEREGEGSLKERYRSGDISDAQERLLACLFYLTCCDCRHPSWATYCQVSEESAHCINVVVNLPGLEQVSLHGIIWWWCVI